MKKLLLFILVSSLSLAAVAQTNWKTDPMHSFVNFAIKHSGISLVDGTFRKFEGTISSEKADFTGAKINFTVDVASISTGVDMRDNHLKSDDFFNAEKFPTMTFESTSFRKTGKSYVLDGKLTIKGVTRDAKFAVVYGGQAKDQQGNTKAGFLATTKINRLDYQINYDPTGLGVGKEVFITLNLQFAAQK